MSAFGAIFTNGLRSRMQDLFAGQAATPRSFSPDAVRAMPPAIHERYLHAFGASLHTVYQVAAVVMAIGFAIAWGLRDIPLRAGQAKR